jgi:hypothetical protein
LGKALGPQRFAGALPGDRGTSGPNGRITQHRGSSSCRCGIAGLASFGLDCV